MTRPHANRAGASLVELVIALSLAAIVLGTATVSVLRQQQTHGRIASVSYADAQVGTTTTAVAGQVALLERGGGDLTPGEASDSALQFRATIASSVSCGTEVGAATLFPIAETGVPLTGISATPRAGDSLWWMGDSAWTGAAIAATSVVSAPCISAGGGGPSLHVVVATADTIPAGVPLRVTRQARYAIYRSGDGSWQLGFREWSAGSGFPAPQPVAGPLMPRSSSRRSGFRYFDSAGAELVVTGHSVDVSRVARIRIVAHSLAAVRSRSQDSVRTDSTDVALRGRSAP